jgi:hypothetical protein
MNILDDIPGSDQKVVDFAAARAAQRADASTCFGKCPRQNADDLRLLLGAVRRVLRGELVLTSAQQVALLASIDALAEAV